MGSRTVRERLQARRQRLKSQSNGVDEQVRRTLAEVWEPTNRDPILLRREFVRLRKPLVGDFSDSNMPPLKARPPAARLLSPRGLALRVYLMSVFDQQCMKPRQGSPAGRPLVALTSSETGLADLVSAPADYSPGAVRAVTSRDNRIRQIKSALDRLAAPDVGLVELPRAGAHAARFRDYRILVEHGSQRAGATPYRPPGDDEEVVLLPPSFFLNGWVHALNNAEIAAYLMVRDLVQASDCDVEVPGQVRVRSYGLTRDTYEALGALSAFGLVEVARDERRRPDGTVEDFDPSDPPAPNRFSLLDDGLAVPAVDTVLQLLDRMIEGAA